MISSSDRRSNGSTGSADRHIRMSQPTLNSSFSGINFVGINKGRLSYPSLRASGDNYINFRIEEERLSVPNVRSTGLVDREARSSQPDVTTHHIRRDLHKRDRLSQPTLVPGDYYPGRGQQRLSQPCLTTVKDQISSVLSPRSPVKQKRFCPPMKATQRDRLCQLDFGTARNRCARDSLTELAPFNRDRFSIPELETENDLKLMAGTPKQRFSLDSSLNESKRRSRLLPIASSPICENHAKVEHGEGITGCKMAVDGLESVLITSTSPLIPKPETVFATQIPQPPKCSSTFESTSVPSIQRMSVPDISTSSLRRLLDPPAKQRHSLTGNTRQCLLTVGQKKSQDKSESNIWKKTPKKDGLESPDIEERTKSRNNVQRHYSYTYEPTKDSSITVKDNLSAAPRKKYLESNFDKNEQVITTVIETDNPIHILNSSPMNLNSAMVYSSEMPRWMRKYLNIDNDTPKSNRKGAREVSEKRDSIDSISSEKDCTEQDSEDGTGMVTNERARLSSVMNNSNTRATLEEKDEDSYKLIESATESTNKYSSPVTTTNRTKSDGSKFYGQECGVTESDDESTSV